jgi:hypothetical protein
MITLESTKIAFDTWRVSKAKVNTPIPKELWDMVKQLLPTYKKGEICKVLGISSRQIKSNCTPTSTTTDRELRSSQAIGNFVEAKPALNVGTAELVLKGTTKSLRLCLPTTALHEILPILGALL